MEFDTYPTKKVILGYGLLGGAVGGVFIDLLMTISEYPIYTSFDKSFMNFLISLFFYAFYGLFFGLIPAMTTGLFVANRKIYLNNKFDFFRVFMIGFVVSGFLTAVITLPFLFRQIFDWLKYICIFGVIGGLSSVIVGKFVLPKGK